MYHYLTKLIIEFFSYPINTQRSSEWIIIANLYMAYSDKNLNIRTHRKLESKIKVKKGIISKY